MKNYDFFSNKVIVITGASSGIGAEMARQMAGTPATLCLMARSEKRLQELVLELSPAGARFCVLPCDVRDAASVKRAFEKIAREYGRVDILVNNAGLGVFGPLDRISIDNLREVIDTNISGVLQVTREALPLMKPQKSGLIVNVSSVAAFHGQPHLIAYSASKAALHSISQGLRIELFRWCIRVLEVQPGVIDNAFHRRALGMADHVYRKKQLKGTGEAFLVKSILHAIIHGRKEMTCPRYWFAYKLADRLFPALIERGIIRFLLPTLPE
ncbi:MAG: SDR family oxidoreductase [Deltaproteobacteria bacterium]|nr:SDR family oxidoreductase [Deltaproteobacteria bacterium]